MTVRPAKTHISLGIRPVWSESSLCAQWVDEDPRFLHADIEDSDQTGRMPRLIWVFAGRTAILLVLSYRGSNDLCAQQRLRSAWTSTQSDQSRCCPHEETLGLHLPFERTEKTLIRLGRCRGWSESLLGAQISVLVLSCSGSLLLFFIVFIQNCPSDPARRRRSVDDNDEMQTLYTKLTITDEGESVIIALETYRFELRNDRVTSYRSNNVVTSILSPNKIAQLNVRHFSVTVWAATWQNQQNECAPSEDSDQPGHPPSLIRVFAVRSVGS